MIKPMLMPLHAFVPALKLQEKCTVQDVIRLEQETDETWFQHRTEQSRTIQPIVVQQERGWCFHLREQRGKC
ncbi:hypothetical protein EHF33_16005 [Deinococcus psychrotolerans]|uniref:Uncharacterized protein n=1 Tax=Deinococcus psychrotolerans TaxID=2489213 RepID=A0A3G8YHB4_9DEIO|nr:hypothetical protein [Deinococcus psychrotolerans]AZI44383.1 hypothetical protein EHF33_16005 [Deinococcus psychrotolerans]